LLFSLEMTKEQVFARSLAKAAKINSQKFSHGGPFDDAEWERIQAASEVICRAPVHIDDTSALDFQEIIRRSRRAVREDGIKIVVVDYLQLVYGNVNAQRKDLEIAEITRAMKGLAKDICAPVVLLSQLNRSLEHRENKRPKLADLRESGAIEQDAEVVIFLYRDEYYYGDNSKDPGTAEIIIAKNRHGRVGMVRVAWEGWRVSFEDLSS
jgi:replicative DNA helicase